MFKSLIAAVFGAVFLLATPGAAEAANKKMSKAKTAKVAMTTTKVKRSCR
jgi:hypothetical protein